jgi:tRNA threonylcarbamoyladenosine biosynthesis protein TsaE
MLLEPTRLLESLADTDALAKDLAQRAKPGALILLLGPLGAGKTTLVQALGRALGSKAQISSPTYTLIHEYPTPEGVLVHIDAYRLPSAEALFELGLEDYLERARLVAVEWGEALEALFPEALVVRLSLSETGREAELTQGGKPLQPAL